MMTLTVLSSSSQVFCRMSLFWDLSYVFLMIRPGLWVLGRQKTGEVTCHFHHMISRIHTISMTFHYLYCSWSPGWNTVCQVLHCKVILPAPLLYSPLWKEVTMPSTLKEWGVMLFEEGNIYINYLKFWILSHLFMYSIIYLSQSGLMNIYFILWVKTQYTLFICWVIFCYFKLFQLCPLRALSVDSYVPPFDVLHISFCLTLLYFLEL